MHQPFFPQEIFDGYFNPKKRKASEHSVPWYIITAERADLFRAAERKGSKKRINLDELGEDAEEAVRRLPSIIPQSHR